MSKITKKLKMIAISAFVLGVLAVGEIAFADARAEKFVMFSDGDPMNNVVSAIAERFNLDADEVRNVVDETMEKKRAKMEARHQQVFADRMEAAVDDGKLTQVQADLILVKSHELKAERERFHESLENMTQEERETALKAHIKSLEQWASDNDIPEEFSFFVGVSHGGPGHAVKFENILHSKE